MREQATELSAAGGGYSEAQEGKSNEYHERSKRSKTTMLFPVASGSRYGSFLARTPLSAAQTFPL